MVVEVLDLQEKLFLLNFKNICRFINFASV